MTLYVRVKVHILTSRANSLEWGKNYNSILANTPQVELWSVLIYQDLYCTKQKKKFPSWGLDHLTGFVYKQRRISNT